LRISVKASNDAADVSVEAETRWNRPLRTAVRPYVHSISPLALDVLIRSRRLSSRVKSSLLGTRSSGVLVSAACAKRSASMTALVASSRSARGPSERDRSPGGYLSAVLWSKCAIRSFRRDILVSFTLLLGAFEKKSTEMVTNPAKISNLSVRSRLLGRIFRGCGSP
jgi:hypothetical protein